MDVVFVEQRDVVVPVFLLGQHPAQTVLNDDRDLVSVGRVVAAAVGNERGEDLAMSVFMLKPFAVERCTSRGTAEQKAARSRIARRPREIADALEAEHRVEDVERHHRQVMIGVRGAGRNPR